MPSWPKDPQRFRPRVDCDGEFVLCINGIFTVPQRQWEWTDLAERYLARNTRHDFDSLEYLADPVFGPLLRAAARAREARALIEAYRAHYARRGVPLRVHLVAHSHGCEIARRLITSSPLHFRSVHFFAAATDADFARNGLNEALAAGRIDRLCLYTSRGDAVLRFLAPLSAGLHGRLGTTGPRNVAAAQARKVTVTPRDTFGHSTWFTPVHFDATMRAVTWWTDELPG